MIELKNLYGGAICAYIPPGACDISKLREVPDHQEVFAHKATDQSIIFDILEFENSVSEEQGAEYHFHDLVGESSQAQISSIQKLNLPNLPPNCDNVYYLVGQNHIAKYHEAAKNIVNLHLVLFRFKAYDTDILVTFNDPVYINPESSSYSETTANNLESDKWTVDQFMKTIETFRIADPSLFNGN